MITYFGAGDDGADAGEDCLRAYDKSAANIQGVVRRLIADGLQPRNGVIVITADRVFRHLTEPATSTGAVATGMSAAPAAA